MALVLVTNYFSITKGWLIMSTPTPSIIITWVGVGLFTHKGKSSGPIVRAQVLPAFNLINEFFEELHMNYQGVNTNFFL